MLPLIAIPLDYLDYEIEPQATWYSKYPWYATRYRYNDSLVKFGASPCFIGYNHALIPEYVKRFDGLIIAGGYFDHDPESYNQTPHSTIKRNSKRSAFEKALLEAYLPTKKPVLGICGGHQLINIICGGTLIQDIATMHNTKIKHSETVAPTEAAHQINIEPGTILSSFYQSSTTIGINSSHHQAIDQVGKDLVVSAVAEDGIIEAIEDPNHPFCLGVQWHPEYLLNELDEAILKNFVKACA
jgi:putative glutamine amidotransferase